MKNIYNLLSNLYGEFNKDNNYAAYEIRLSLGEDPSEVILCWDNYDYGFSATRTIISPTRLPNWAIRLLHKGKTLWASECDGTHFVCEGGVE